MWVMLVLVNFGCPNPFLIEDIYASTPRVISLGIISRVLY